MTKRILSIATLLTVGLLFTACHDQSSKKGIPPTDGDAKTQTETAVVDEHAGHDHGDADGHNHGTDMDAMDNKGTDLGFEEGSWSWTLQDYLDNGSGAQSFNLDQVSYEGDELSAEGAKQLDDLATLLKAHPDMEMEIRCHSREANNAVGRTAKRTATELRAGWVQAKLIARGVPAKQMKSKGMADDELISGIDGKDDSQNRITVFMTK